MRQKTSPLLDRLSHLLDRASALTRDLPGRAVRACDRRSLAAHLWTEAPALSECVALVLSHRRQLFPDVPIPPEAILESQAAADAYLALARSFSALAAVCMDSYQSHQAEAVLQCKQVVHHVAAGARHPSFAPHLQHPLRVGLLDPALRILQRCRQPRKAPAKQRTPARPRADRALRRQHLHEILSGSPPDDGPTV